MGEKIFFAPEPQVSRQQPGLACPPLTRSMTRERHLIISPQNPVNSHFSVFETKEMGLGLVSLQETTLLTPEFLEYPVFIGLNQHYRTDVE